MTGKICIYIYITYYCNLQVVRRLIFNFPLPGKHVPTNADFVSQIISKNESVTLVFSDRICCFSIKLELRVRGVALKVKDIPSGILKLQGSKSHV